jgi:outer membrane lipoprotein
VRDDPEGFKGKTVILGGEIIDARVGPDGPTTLVILEKPLNTWEEPKAGDQSQGRFLVNVSRFLDPVVYASGRRVTVAGTVVGVENEPVGQTLYRYLVLQGVEVYLWPVPKYRYPACFYDPFFDPFFPHPVPRHRRW